MRAGVRAGVDQRLAVELVGPDRRGNHGRPLRELGESGRSPGSPPRSAASPRRPFPARRADARASPASAPRGRCGRRRPQLPPGTPRSACRRSRWLRRGRRPAPARPWADAIPRSRDSGVGSGMVVFLESPPHWAVAVVLLLLLAVLSGCSGSGGGPPSDANEWTCKDWTDAGLGGQTAPGDDLTSALRQLGNEVDRVRERPGLRSGTRRTRSRFYITQYCARNPNGRPGALGRRQGPTGTDQGRAGRGASSTRPARTRRRTRPRASTRPSPRRACRPPIPELR